MNSMLKLPALDLLGGDIVLDRVEDAIIAIAHGEMVIVVDDADRENEAT
jgi:3,4-dihydroxy 2-butanone 4-phosphate synthase